MVYSYVYDKDMCVHVYVCGCVYMCVHTDIYIQTYQHICVREYIFSSFRHSDWVDKNLESGGCPQDEELSDQGTV